jgi:hypothetical protein
VVSLKIIVLLKLIKSVSLLLETQTDTLLHVRVHYSVAQLMESQNEANGANRTHRHGASVAEYEVMLAALSSANYYVVCSY